MLINKIMNIMKCGIYVILTITLAIILILNLFSQNVDYFCKKEFLISNKALLIFAFCIYLILAIIISKKEIGTVSLNLKKNAVINWASLVLLLGLIYLSYNIYFMTGWDAGIVINDAKSIAKDRIIDSYYYSIFPNQQFLLYLESILFKINNTCKIIKSNEGLMILIIFQCILTSLTGNTLYWIIYDYTQSKHYAWLGWMTFCLLIAISGWITIPYTDGMAIYFPVLILRLFQKKEQCINTWKRMSYWILIALLSYWGFKTKPTVLIIFIAIVIGEVLYSENINDKNNIKQIGQVIVSIIFCFAISNIFFHLMMDTTNISIDEELDMGPLHMIMIGLNNDTDGVWNGNDLVLSARIKLKDERQKAQIETIKQRLSDYGIEGLLRHTAKKSLVIFNDGTFAWGAEGAFYTQIYDEKNNHISPKLRQIFYNAGIEYPKLATMEQGIWMLTLFLCGFCLILKKNKLTTVIVTAIIGIIMFNYIFEARARYVMIYVSIFIILAIICLSQIGKIYANKINTNPFISNNQDNN